ncbi:MAG: outer membrane beta-barrel protein [Gammaproteobacteria bacterium]|nr:outer membrane beta-barrel protein [Gammaproteobacteria bacterium]MDH3446872.1 outer membrane beta-barrel protein [Gammaproteobacteria bacterium]
MRVLSKLAAIIILAAAASPGYAAEMKTFFGIDAVEMESTLGYSNGNETYEFTGVRLRYGLEAREGGSAGIEIMPAMEDEQIDPFGDLFELSIGPSLAAYFTIGKPVYLRLGFSFTEFEYTDIASGISDKDTASAIELGLGFNISPSENLTFYGEFLRRDSGELILDTFFFGEVDQVSDMVSLGVNFKF